MESNVLIETIFADRFVSESYFKESMVVIAPTGAQQDITIEINIVSLIPAKYISPSTKSGKITNLEITASIHFKSVKPLRMLLFAM